MGTFRVHRAFLIALIGSLVAAALMGVLALLVDPWVGPTSERIIATTLTVTLFSLTSMGCAIAWERGRWRAVAVVGLGVSALSFLAFLPGIWLNLSYRWEDAVVKTMGVGVSWSVGLALLVLVALARLKRAWLWTRYATQAVAVLLGASITAAILLHWESSDYFRYLSVLAILTGCGAICMPILHRLSVMPRHDRLVTTGLALTITCPRCAASQEVSAGRSKCRQCGLKFRIEIEEATCAACGYPLYKLASNRCPECGTPFALGAADGPAQGPG